MVLDFSCYFKFNNLMDPTSKEGRRMLGLDDLDDSMFCNNSKFMQNILKTNGVAKDANI